MFFTDIEVPIAGVLKSATLVALIVIIPVWHWYWQCFFVFTNFNATPDMDNYACMDHRMWKFFLKTLPKTKLFTEI